MIFSSREIHELRWTAIRPIEPLSSCIRRQRTSIVANHHLFAYSPVRPRRPLEEPRIRICRRSGYTNSLEGVQTPTAGGMEGIHRLRASFSTRVFIGTVQRNNISTA